MIDIKILKSNASSITGDILFNKNLIYIGNSIADDITDIKIKNSPFFLEIVEKDLLFHQPEKTGFYFLNDKKYKGVARLKIGDIIRVETLTFKVNNFQKELISTTKEYLNSSSLKLVESNSSLLNLIRDIKKNAKQ